MTALRLLAPAKLNLVLRVVGRRADGYHLLETLFHAIDCCDELVLVAPDGSEAPSLTVDADDPRDRVEASADNLVLRAARAFADATGAALGCRFWLRKRIPHGGGLGGGSSDAAAALRLLNRSCGEPLDAAALHRLAAPLGADVAFFLRGGTQWGRGIGDELSTVDDPPNLHFVLVLPPFSCPTVEVYKNHSAHWNTSFDAATVRSARNDRHHHRHKDSPVRDRFEEDLEANDLAAAAERVRPELRAIRARVAALGVPSIHMTGSGSTLFVPAADAERAAAIQARLQPLAAEGVRLLTARTLQALPAVERIDWPRASDGDVRGVGGCR